MGCLLVLARIFSELFRKKFFSAEEGLFADFELLFMCADVLERSYDRATLLHEMRVLARMLKQLSRGGLMGESSCARKAYMRWYRRLVYLRAFRALNFPPPVFNVPASPLTILQRVYDHYKDFRFIPQDLERIAKALLPARVFVIRKGRKDVSADGVVALAVVLRHLAFPERQDRQARFWGRSVTWVSRIFHATLNLLYNHAQSAFRHWPRLHFMRIPNACCAMAEKSSDLLFAHLLLDGSGISICRPSGFSEHDNTTQRYYYSGKERCHVIRILGMVSLTGLFVHVFGSFPGSAADETIYRVEDVEQQLDDLHNRAVAAFNMQRRPMVAGDGGFTASRNIVTPFAFDPNAPVFSAENVYNLVHSKMRIPNEWGFGRVVNAFQTLQFRMLLKAAWTDPDKQYVVGMLMTNFIVICEGSQTQSYFGMHPPSLEEYLQHVLE